jgi:hypothetical protein
VMVAPVLEPEAEPEPDMVAPRRPRAEAPSFESFVVEGWQRWLGASA